MILRGKGEFAKLYYVLRGGLDITPEELTAPRGFKKKV